MSGDPADNDGRSRLCYRCNPIPSGLGPSPCDQLLATLAPFARVVLVSHVNPDPDSLASMLGVQALLRIGSAWQARHR